MEQIAKPQREQKPHRHQDFKSKENQRTNGRWKPSPPVLPTLPPDPWNYPSRNWYIPSQECPAKNGQIFPVEIVTLADIPPSLPSPPLVKVNGLVLRGAKLKRNRNSPDSFGIVHVDGQDVHFTIDDLPKKKSLWPGDLIQCSIIRNEKTQESRAVNLELVEPTELPEELGKVVTFKGGYGFIRRGNDEEIYFHLNEVEEGLSIRLGSNVSFNVMDLDNGKTIAIRIKVLPKKERVRDQMSE